MLSEEKNSRAGVVSCLGQKRSVAAEGHETPRGFRANMESSGAGTFRRRAAQVRTVKAKRRGEILESLGSKCKKRRQRTFSLSALVL